MKELLLLLCRYPFDESNRDILSKLIKAVHDWHEMVGIINAHGIIALAAYNIRESGLEKEIPGEAMAALENGYMQSMIRNTWLTERWKEVNEVLCNAGIKHILLKGMALEHTIYGARGLRQMNDCDILIKPEDSVKAWQLLQREGFIAEPFKSKLFDKIKFEFGHHLPALFKNGYTIEIHDNLFYSRETDNKSLSDPFVDPVEIFIGDTKALILNKEVHLKYLIRHFEHHTRAGDCQLRLYTDIKLLDPDSNPDIPDRFISDPKQATRPEFRRAAYKTNLCSITPKHRLRFLLGDLFPSVKWMKNRYGCTGLKVLLYYPLRIGKLGWLIK